MPVCVPVRDMKNTSSFVSLVDKERDVTVTKNGYSAIHCLSEDEYKLLKEEHARAKLLSRMLLAEEELKNGELVEYDGFAASIREKYGL